MAVELYSGKNLKLLWSEGEGYPYCFIAFSAWSNYGVGQPFGLSFFEKNKISAFYIVQCGGNLWWHTPEIIEICRIVRDRVKKSFDGSIMYGSSMGGYAAIHLQDFFRAGLSFSIAPQVVVSNVYADFETRWSEDRANIDAFLFDEKKNLSFQIDKTVVLLDREHEQDNKHINFLECFGLNNELVDVPYSNHDAARALVLSGVMKPCLMEIAENGTIDVANLRKEAAVSFEKDSKTFFNFFRRNLRALDSTSLNHYMLLFESFIGKGMVKDFESAYMVAEIFSYLGDAEKAIEYSERSMSLYPIKGSIPNYLILKHCAIQDRLDVQ